MSVIVLDDGTTIVPYNSSRTGPQMDAAMDGGDSVGNLTNLTTTEKSSAVGAINEVNGEVININEDLFQFNCIDLLKTFATYTSRTVAGVTFTWNEKKTECYVSGTSSGTAITNLYSSTSAIPSCFEQGKTYNVIYDTTDNDIELEIGVYLDGATTGAVTTRITSNIEYTIPTDATGMYIRLRVYNGHNADGTVNKLAILNTMSNKELENAVKYNPWEGKTWYSFGTSMSDMNMDGVTGNNPAVGSYPWVLEVDKLGKMIRTNKAIGSGGICPSLSHGGNVKTNIMACPWNVDLVTLECGLNDWSNIALGDYGDTSDNTFIGNFTQCIKYLSENTRAKIVVISVPKSTYTDSTQTNRVGILEENLTGETYRDVIDLQKEICKLYGAEYIDADAMMPQSWRNHDTVIDHIHLSQKGGTILGDLIWSKLKNMLPCPVAFDSEEV